MLLVIIVFIIFFIILICLCYRFFSFSFPPPVRTTVRILFPCDANTITSIEKQNFENFSPDNIRPRVDAIISRGNAAEISRETILENFNFSNQSPLSPIDQNHV